MTLEDALGNYIAAPNGCWMWAGCVDWDGYGQVRCFGRDWRVSRLVLTTKLGRPIKPKHFACHTCDEPTCIRPEHLYEGTANDNMADMKRRGRSLVGDRNPSRSRPGCLLRGDESWSRNNLDRVARGSRQWMSKLTDEAVLAIRASTLSKKELAAMYGVSGCTIRDIRVGDTWTHLLPK